MLMILVLLLLITIIVLRYLDIMEKKVDHSGVHKFNKNTCILFDDPKEKV